MGVSGARHSVVDPPPGSAPDVRAYAADGPGDELAVVEAGAIGAGDAQALDYFDEPPDSGIAILGGIATTEVPGDAPTAPQPALNEPIARPPRPVGDAAIRPTASSPGFGTGYGGNKTMAASGSQPKNVRDLALDQRVRIWRWRAIIMVVVGVAVGLLLRSWPIGLTLAVVAGIIDTVYRARTVASIPTGGSPDRAQRRTQHQLAKMRRAGYHTLHARPIPDSREVIDHLVVGPTGVYAIDSEKWLKDLPIRTRNGKQLWHGPESKKQRLEHARWEAQQASDRLSAALGYEVEVRPAMAVYGPPIPWDIATIRDVDVFSGPRLRKYLRRRARMKKDVPRLTRDQVREIYDAAGKVLPDVTPTRARVAQTRSATPVG
jgi:Nuclease-related domain